MNRDLSREELFLLIWERPAKEIAKDLGVSGTDLSKLCRRLQVPKPPAGYWTQIKAGERPQKPLLREFSDQIARFQEKQVMDGDLAPGWIHLSPLQVEITTKAIDVLRSAGVDIGELRMTNSGTRFLTSDMASQLILVIQNQYVKWLRERSATVINPHTIGVLFSEPNTIDGD